MLGLGLMGSGLRGYNGSVSSVNKQQRPVYRFRSNGDNALILRLSPFDVIQPGELDAYNDPVVHTERPNDA